MQLYYLQSTDIQETLDAYASVKAQNEVKTVLTKNCKLFTNLRASQTPSVTCVSVTNMVCVCVCVTLPGLQPAHNQSSPWFLL